MVVVKTEKKCKLPGLCTRGLLLIMVMLPGTIPCEVGILAAMSILQRGRKRWMVCRLGLGEGSAASKERGEGGTGVPVGCKARSTPRTPTLGGAGGWRGCWRRWAWGSEGRKEG
jgi:hypothetical protein